MASLDESAQRRASVPARAELRLKSLLELVNTETTDRWSFLSFAASPRSEARCSNGREHSRRMPQWQDVEAFPLRIDTVELTPQGPRYAHLMAYSCPLSPGRVAVDAATGQ